MVVTAKFVNHDNLLVNKAFLKQSKGLVWKKKQHLVKGQLLELNNLRLMTALISAKRND